MLTIALIVNPLAGIGGPAGLAGSDGAATQAEAIARGAQPLAGERAARFLRQLRRLRPGFELSVAAAGEMGAAVARREGIEPVTVAGGSRAAGTRAEDRGAEGPSDLLGRTTAADTAAAARAMLAADPRPDVIVFAGGDGTARDVHDAVGQAIPVLGVPAGVKMQSAVFARSPEAAAALLAGWNAEAGATAPREVADIDEEARRRGRVVSQIWGELRVPAGAEHLQGGKVGQTQAARGSLPGLAAGLAERLDPAKAWLMGPGGTIRGVAEELGLPASLLGVDLHLPRARANGVGTNGADTNDGDTNDSADGAGDDGARDSHLDLSAAEIERLLSESGAQPQVVVSPVGGQGFLLGRGNQQIGAAVLRRLEPDDLLIVAAPAKLGELGGGPLYADLPEGAPAERLLGPRRVITGRRDTAMIRLLAA